MTIARPHRGMLDESLALSQPCHTFDELLAIIRKDLEPFGVPVSLENVTVSDYGYDYRIGHHVHIVEIKGYGVWGMTDGPVEKVR